VRFCAYLAKGQIETPEYLSDNIHSTLSVAYVRRNKLLSLVTSFVSESTWEDETKGEVGITCMASATFEEEGGIEGDRGAKLAKWRRLRQV
jgi:hypothetical protein